MSGGGPRASALRAVVAAGAAAIAGTAALPGSGGASSDRPVARPHVVVYLIDTVRADRVSGYGHPIPTTPAIDRLAREGVLFALAHAPSSWTRPSTASVLTGLYPSEHGAVSSKDSLRGVATLAELLREQGYFTAAVTANPNVVPQFGFGRGFDTFVDVEEAIREPSSAEVLAAVVEVLDARPESPLFLYVHVRDPHGSYEPPPEYLFGPKPDEPIPDRLRRYDGEIAYSDRVLGRFVAAMQQRGLWDDTMLFVLSDHGEEFSDHGRFHHGRTLYQEQLLVPLVLRLPDGRRGDVVAKPVLIQSVVPTVCDVLGIAPPAGVRGTSLRRAPGAEPVFAELELSQNIAQSVTRGRYKLIERLSPEPAGRSLFDLETDPGERTDLAGERNELVGELWLLLDFLRDARREERDTVDVDPEIEERLRALGYVE